MYFADLPLDKPELRAVLINLHRAALEDNPLNVGAAEKMIMTDFGVADNTARGWLEFLEEKRFIVRRSGKRKNAIYLLPSLQSKSGLQKIGIEYLVAFRMLSQLLEEATEQTIPNEVVMDSAWTEDIKTALRKVLKTEMADYATLDPPRPKKPR
jgi:hypothetical protein